MVRELDPAAGSGRLDSGPLLLGRNLTPLRVWRAPVMSPSGTALVQVLFTGRNRFTGNPTGIELVSISLVTGRQTVLAKLSPHLHFPDVTYTGGIVIIVDQHSDGFTPVVGWVGRSGKVERLPTG